jgi:hypothetical protein
MEAEKLMTRHDQHKIKMGELLQKKTSLLDIQRPYEKTRQYLEKFSNA